jgi:hypothetical protein
MNENILKIINQEFEKSQTELVINELESITLKHVMAESEFNLNNTRMSILKLAKGNLNEVIYLTKTAKIDFRDVIMWATELKQ